MRNLDRTIHEPVRLRILMILSGVDVADFKFLGSTLGLTKGNLSSHVARLEGAGYIEVRKSFNGKIPHTDYRLTEGGRKALSKYWAALDEIRACGHGIGGSNVGEAARSLDWRCRASRTAENNES